ncbi:MAG: HAMP domain-containing histidine kinase [Clostridia bacterium]|nr:HAMP domain-containing histidine kinase [Clostridia bacterium]
MLKKLRIKFVLVTMIATMLVLCAIIGGINANNWIRVNKNAEKTLTMIVNNGGSFPQRPKPPTQEPEQPQRATDVKEPSGAWRAPDGMSPEAPYETRYFTVTLDVDGKAVSADTKNIAAIDDDRAISIATTVALKGKTSGRYENYKYVAAPFNDGKVMYVFLDCTRDFNSFYDFLKASCFISLAGYIVVWLLVVVLSGLVMKPVAETYKKQKQFITDANHELKTPLTVINADCELMEYTYGESEWTNSIKDQVAKLTELTNKLVFLSKMDEENKVAMSEFSLSEVAREAIEPFVAVCKSKNKKFVTNISQSISCVGNVKMTKELMELLLDNAVKYSDEQGNIEFTLTGSGKTGKIIVSNTTKGVPQGNLDVLFERFYRLDGSRNSATGGHGIGLSVAKAIVEQQKGKITAYSPDGKKIVFTVIL